MPDDMTKRPPVNGVVRLSDLDDYQVAEGEPDPRGWDVKTADGQTVGKVASLLVDTSAMQVRSLDVELDKSALNLADDRHVLVPIGGARLDDDNDHVLLGTMTATQLVALPAYRASGAPMPTPTSTSQDSDELKSFYGKRGGTGGVQRMTLSEEELKVGTRRTQASDIDVRNTL